MLRTTRLVGIALTLFAFAGSTGCANLSSNVLTENAAELDTIYDRHHDLKELVDRLARRPIETGHNVGIVVGILDETGNKHVFSYGKTSISSDVSPDGNTVFAIGSLTKSFVALLLQDLIKDGSVDPAETVGDILPHESDFSAAAKKITLYQLANHASGLPRQPNNFRMFVSLINYSFTGENIYRHIDKQEMYGFLREYTPDEEDIGAYRYSNIGMALLGHLIEVKTGKTLPDLLTERILRPLGLNDTTYALDEEKAARLAMGYVGASPFFVPRNTPVANWEMDDILKGAAGLYSTVNDLLTFAQYRIGISGIPVVNVPVNHGIFDLHRQQFHPVSLGWDIDEFEDGKRIVFQHGMIAGYTAYIGVEEEKGLAVVVLYNNFDWDDEIGHNLLLTLARSQTSVSDSASAKALQP